MSNEPSSRSRRDDGSDRDRRGRRVPGDGSPTRPQGTSARTAVASSGPASTRATPMSSCRSGSRSDGATRTRRGRCRSMNSSTRAGSAGGPPRSSRRARSSARPIRPATQPGSVLIDRSDGGQPGDRDDVPRPRRVERLPPQALERGASTVRGRARRPSPTRSPSAIARRARSSRAGRRTCAVGHRVYGNWPHTESTTMPGGPGPRPDAAGRR